MGLDPQTQADARTKKHPDVCNGYLPTEPASEEEQDGLRGMLRLLVPRQFQQ